MTAPGSRVFCVQHANEYMVVWVGIGDDRGVGTIFEPVHDLRPFFRKVESVTMSRGYQVKTALPNGELRCNRVPLAQVYCSLGRLHSASTIM
jgi:hypothetical protein